MKSISYKPGSGWLSALCGAIAIMAVLSMGVAQAAPLAGSTIGNQAAATYTDASAIVRTATSNTVVTTVSQVASLLLVNTQSVTAAPGQPVTLPHTLTNTGNGTDTFNLTSTLTAGGAGLSAVSYYPDNNCDGIADAGLPAIAAVGPLAAGARVCFVAMTTVSGTALAASTGSNIVTATSAFTVGVTATNTDTITVSSNAVIGVTKSGSVAAAVLPRTGVDITYTLSYTNTGNSTATDLVLADVVPTGATYVAASAKWNGVAVADGLVAAAAPAAGTITYDYNLTTPGNFAVTARIGSVAPNSSGNLSFTVNVPATTLPGTINNSARFCYNNGVAVTPALTTSSTCSTLGNPTNVVPYIVSPTYGVIASDYFQSPNLQGVLAVTPTASTTTDGLAALKNDIVTVDAATQGATVSFDNVIANTGNSSDTINISTQGSTFPAGTTFLYFKSDGVTPLTDSNGDGIVDTGPLAAGAVFHVFIKAVLPATAFGGPSSVTVKAASVGNPAFTDLVTDTLTTITTTTADLTNTAALPAATAAQGAGVFATPALAVAANLGVAITTNAVNPGASTTFVLVANNTSGIADNYGISVDQTQPGTALPAGWAVNFYSTATPLNCATLGAALSNTGVVAAGANTTICAVVTVPVSQAALPGGQKIVFKLASPTTGATDFKMDMVTVNTIRSISLTPNNGSQVYPGGTVVYKHILTNTGNVTETASLAGGVTVTSALSGVTLNWGNVLYADTNNNGILDAADAQLTSVTLTAGQSITVFNKVLAPASAAAGDVNTVLLTATQTDPLAINGVAVPAPSTAQDVTTVIAGQISLVKLQQLDATCAGIVVPASWTNAAQAAKPGECILYQITGTNVGTTAALTLVISDSTPANTTYNCKTAPATPAGGAAAVALTVAGVVTATATAPAVCAAGTVSSGTIPSLAPGAAAVMTFGVQVNP